MNLTLMSDTEQKIFAITMRMDTVTWSSMFDQGLKVRLEGNLQYPIPLSLLQVKLNSG